MNDIELSRHINIIWKWLWLILISMVLAGATAYRASQLIQPIYRVSTTVQVGDDVSNPNLSSDDITKSQRIAGGYATAAQRQPVLEATAKALNLPMDWRQLQKQVLVSHDDASQLITIYVVDTDPVRDAAIANEVARQLILQSPTAQLLQDRLQSQQFLGDQLKQLQSDIQKAEQQLTEKKAALDKDTNARSILDDQDQIKAIETKLTDWRSTYASLLSTQQVKPANTVTVVDRAVAPLTSVSPNIRVNVATTAGIAFVIALAAVLLLEYLNDRITTSEDVLRALNQPTIGWTKRLGRIRNPTDRLVTATAPHTAASEAYRLIRTNILLNSVQVGMAPILVTSPGLGEGKSIISANLAVCFAQMGKRVILVDADLRRPTVHTVFQTTNDVGLTTLVENAVSMENDALPNDANAIATLRDQVETLLQPTGTPDLRVLPAGPMSAHPADLLAAPVIAQLLRVLEELADVVILDSAPLLPVADTTILAGLGVAVVLVVEAGKTRIGAAHAVREALVRARARVIGVVLNKAASSPHLAYDYAYTPAKPAKTAKPTPAT